MAAAAAYPPWVMLEHYCTCEAQGCSPSIADTNTTARGHAAPPEGSRVCLQLPAGVETYNPVVLASHGDSVVVQVTITTGSATTDRFVYSAGDASAEPPRPPSLWLLPPHSISYLNTNSTGRLVRGDGGDFVVAELQMQYVVKQRDGNKVNYEAPLHLLRSGSCEWRVVKPVISRYAAGTNGGLERVDDLDHLASSLGLNKLVIPVGDRMLCWVDLEHGLLFSDNVFDESPSLRYVPLPEDPHWGQRSVCTTAGGTAIKFVNVFSRCCCGAAGKYSCRGSGHAYAVHTWTLRMDDMTWAMDGSFEATQLWTLDGYSGLPRIELDYPIVNMDDPDAICFDVRDHCEKPMWRIMVDMKNRTLPSVFRCPKGRWCRHRSLPSRVSKYFNSKPTSSGQPPPVPAAQAEAMLNLLTNRMVNNKLHAINNTMQGASPEAVILVALQEIPGLDRDDMLKAYRILAHDDSGRRFRALMGLPLDFRNDCVLMEIKASESCVLCSACSADLQLKD